MSAELAAAQSRTAVEAYLGPTASIRRRFVEIGALGFGNRQGARAFLGIEYDAGEISFRQRPGGGLIASRRFGSSRLDPHLGVSRGFSSPAVIPFDRRLKSGGLGRLGTPLRPVPRNGRLFLAREDTREIVAVVVDRVQAAVRIDLAAIMGATFAHVRRRAGEETHEALRTAWRSRRRRRRVAETGRIGAEPTAPDPVGLERAAVPQRGESLAGRDFIVLGGEGASTIQFRRSAGSGGADFEGDAFLGVRTGLGATFTDTIVKPLELRTLGRTTTRAGFFESKQRVRCTPFGQVTTSLQGGGVDAFEASIRGARGLIRELFSTENLPSGDLSIFGSGGFGQ